MPEGNKHYTPSGIWWQSPTTSSKKILFLKTVRNVAIFGAVIQFVFEFRKIQQNYTYSNFRGKILTLGNITSLTHEPWSVEEIDKLKEAERAKKAAAKEAVRQ